MDCFENSVLVEMHRLNIVLIVIAVIQLVMHGMTGFESLCRQVARFTTFFVSMCGCVFCIKAMATKVNARFKRT